MRFHPKAITELNNLPTAERAAMMRAVEKLESLGDRLPFPHQSGVKGQRGLRELRPRGGRSPWRAFYRRSGNALVVAAIGPEAAVDKHGFNRTVQAAATRLDSIESREV